MRITTFHGTLVAQRHDIYSVWVFKKDDDEFVLCTVLPNWGLTAEIGDCGYVQIEEARTGEYYTDKKTQTEQKYGSDNIYLKDFVKDNKQTDLIL